jgi:hypothetical protein
MFIAWMLVRDTSQAVQSNWFIFIPVSIIIHDSSDYDFLDQQQGTIFYETN